MKNYIAINQNFFEEDKALISVKERAARFGDGVFETCKISDSFIYDYKNHENRLKKGSKILQINADVTALKGLCRDLVKKNQVKNGILRISISRGIGSVGYLPKDDIKPLIIVETILEARYPSSKIVIGVSKIKAPKRMLELQKCKTMQALNYVLTKINAKKSGHFDDIMLSQEGFVAECSSTNIFWVKKGKIYTPSISCDILCGLTRQKIIDDYGVKINLVKARLASLASANEIFLTNSNFLVLPVDELKIGKKIIKLKKNISLQILQWLNNDIKRLKQKEDARK